MPLRVKTPARAFPNSIAIGLRNEDYYFLEHFFYSSYFIDNRYISKNVQNNFTEFFLPINTINQYYDSIYSKILISPIADLIVNRIPDFLTNDIIVEADLLSHYIGILQEVNWFPITYIYQKSTGMKLFKKLNSIRHFEKVKGLFNVSTPIELKSKLITIKNSANSNQIRYPNSFNSVSPLFEIIDVDSIASTK